MEKMKTGIKWMIGFIFFLKDFFWSASFIIPTRKSKVQEAIDCLEELRSEQLSKVPEALRVINEIEGELTDPACLINKEERKIKFHTLWGIAKEKSELYFKPKWTIACCRLEDANLI